MTGQRMCVVCYARPREADSVKCEDCGAGDKNREAFNYQERQQ